MNIIIKPFFCNNLIWWGQTRINRDTDSFNTKYITSFYWATVTLLTTGYGDIAPSTTQEMVYAIMIVVIGSILFGWIIGKITDLILGKDLQTQLIEQRVEQARLFCNIIGLDKHQTRNVVLRCSIKEIK